MVVQPRFHKWIQLDLLKTSVQDIVPKASAILFDPPWPAASVNSTRGPQINYKMEKLNKIFDLDLNELQGEGLLAIWVINKSYEGVFKWLKEYNYEVQGEMHWLKMSVNGVINPSIGHYLQHATETCIFAKKGNYNWKLPDNTVVAAMRGIQSQKPWFVHELIEQQKVGLQVEYFGRFLNFRKHWYTIGNAIVPNKNQWYFFRDGDMLL
jgi:N6-adenosine-specific RNA methylase IME4